MLFNERRIFWGYPKNIKIDRSRIEKTSNDHIALFTTISVSDANNNYFPLDKIDICNFSVYEKCENKKREATVLKVEPLENTQSSIMITIALDCSSSMKNNDKIEKSKSAIIALLNGLREYPNLECSVALYYVTTENRGYAGEKKFYQKKEFDDLISIIGNTTAKGYTPLWESLSLIVDDFNEHTDAGYQFIICLSDGKDENPTETTETSYSTAKDKILRAKIPFIFIGYGGKNYADMIELAEQSGAGKMGIGYFIDVEPNEIKPIFEYIARSITKSYKVYWKPTFKERNKNIDVRVEIRYKTPYGKIATEDNLEYML